MSAAAKKKAGASGQQTNFGTAASSRKSPVDPSGGKKQSPREMVRAAKERKENQKDKGKVPKRSAGKELVPAQGGGFRSGSQFVLRPYIPDVENYPDESIIRIAKDPIRLKEDAEWRATLPERQWYEPQVPIRLPLVAPEDRLEHTYKLLWKGGADVNQRAEGGTTPLWWAAEAGDLKLAALLLEKKADPALTDADGMQELPLHKAAVRGDSTMCELLLKESVKRGMHDLVERENASGFTPLQLCVTRRDTATLRQLLEYKADINRGNRAMGGDSPLIEVIRSRDMDYVERLILYGASVRQQNMIKDEPLHVAATLLWKDCVSMLIRNRADANARNGRGKTALEIVTEKDVQGDGPTKEREAIMKMLSAYERGPPIPRRTDARFDK